MTIALTRGARTMLSGAICIAALLVASLQPLQAETPAYYETIQYIDSQVDHRVETNGRLKSITSAIVAAANFCRDFPGRLLGSTTTTSVSDDDYIAVASAEDASNLRMISGHRSDHHAPPRSRF